MTRSLLLFVVLLLGGAFAFQLASNAGGYGSRWFWGIVLGYACFLTFTVVIAHNWQRERHEPKGFEVIQNDKDKP